MRKARVKSRSESEPRRAYAQRAGVGVALFLILLLGLWLRMRHLGDESPWFDEIITLRHLDATSLSDFLERVRDRNEPVAPVYLALEYCYAHTFGCSWYGLRVLSVLIGMTTIVALFDLTALLFGPLAGLLAALAVAINVTHIYFSQEIRMYALVGLLAVLSMRSYIAFHEKGGRLALAANVILNLLLVWTHPIALTLAGVQGAHLLFFKRRPARDKVWWLLSHALIGASIVLWALGRDPVRMEAQMGYVYPPTLIGFRKAQPSLQSYHLFLLGTLMMMRLRRMALIIPITFAAVYGWLALRRKDSALSTPSPNSRETAALLLAWLIVPPLAVFAVSFCWKPCFVERYLLFSTFPFYMILGALVALVRPPAVKALIAVVVLGIASASLLLLPAVPFRQPAAQVAHQIRWNAALGDAVIIKRRALNFNITLAHFMRRGDLTIENASNAGRLKEEIAAALARKSSVWIIGFNEPSLPHLVKRLGYKGTSMTWEGNDPLQLVYVPKQVN